MSDTNATVSFVRALRDNYIWLIHGLNAPERIAIVDPGDADPVLEKIQADNLQPAAILLTHHHPDHTNGVNKLVQQYHIPVYGPAKEAHQHVTLPCKDGDTIQLPELGLTFSTLDIPGHTKGHIAFHGHGALFCGDTLFSGGCGRLFEGTPAQMLDSLTHLSRLPAATRVFCGHEYTVANLDFGLTVEPDNATMREHRTWAQHQTAAGRASLPSTLALEQQINVFLRCHLPEVQKAVSDWSDEPLNGNVSNFAKLRLWKDHFRG